MGCTSLYGPFGPSFHFLCYFLQPLCTHLMLQGYSPIHPASWRNCLKAIKMCEEAGANMNHITKTGWSTLTCSLKNTNGAMGGDLAHIEPVMDYLMKKGDKIGAFHTFVDTGWSIWSDSWLDFDFGMFHHLPGFAWADGKLAELAE